jgi:hypothetical protein
MIPDCQSTNPGTLSLQQKELGIKPMHSSYHLRSGNRNTHKRALWNTLKNVTTLNNNFVLLYILILKNDIPD